MAHIILVDLRENNGHVLFISEGEDNVAIFKTEGEAKDCADDHHLCEAFPYSIIDLDNIIT